MSKIVTVEVGCRSVKIPNGHMPLKYQFEADVIVNIVGGYGIVSGGNNCKSRRVAVKVPDWIAQSTEYNWNMARPGCISKNGTHDLCFVTCNARPRITVDLFGAANQDALIDEAIASGLTLHYPEPDGSMSTMSVSLA